MEPVDRAEFVVEVTTGLEALMRMQETGVQKLPKDLRHLDQADFRTAALGFFVELGELVNECQWKPWRSYDPPSPAERQKVLKELGDVLHFLPWVLRNLEERYSIEAADVAQATYEAHEENMRRFEGRVPGREPPPAESGWSRLDIRNLDLKDLIVRRVAAEAGISEDQLQVMYRAIARERGPA